MVVMGFSMTSMNLHGKGMPYQELPTHLRGVIFNKPLNKAIPKENNAARIIRNKTLCFLIIISSLFHYDHAYYLRFKPMMEKTENLHYLQKESLVLIIAFIISGIFFF